MPNQPKVFISYARSDGEQLATALRKQLEETEPELTLWQDRARLEGGKDWWKFVYMIIAMHYVSLNLSYWSGQLTTIRG
jgi:hypothetical protein